MRVQDNSTPLTLKDIARQAGVSLATVDRVLHNRPGVRPDTVRRVKEAVERNAFQPHVAAAELARGRARRFAFVMPSGPNLFMQQIQSYLGEMSAWLSARRLAVEMVATDVFDAAMLASKLESLAGDFDGVAVVALDHPSVRAAINDLVDGGTKVVTLVSDVPSSRRHHHEGIADIVGLYNAGAGTPGVAKALIDTGRANQIVFVGHDVTVMTRKLLLQGVMDAVISQNPGHEARAAVRVLLALARGEPILSEQEKIRIDIVMRDNLP